MDYGKPLQVSMTDSGKGTALAPLFSMAAIAPAFLVRFLDYGGLITAIGSAAVAVGVMALFAKSWSKNLSQAFSTMVVLFLIAVTCKNQPAFAAAAWGVWCWKKAATDFWPSGNGPGKTMLSDRAVLQTVFGFCAAFILITWTAAGAIGILPALGFAALMAATAAAVDGLVWTGESGPLAELASVVLPVSLLSFNPLNMLYGQDVWTAFAVAGVSAFVLYKTGTLGKKAAWLFTAFGTVVFFALDTSGFILFFMFQVISEAGGRINRQRGTPPHTSGAESFVAQTFPAVLLAAVSTGWADPYLFYCAFAGSLGASAFYSWNPAVLEPHAEPVSVKNSLKGLAGLSLTALCAILFQFIPINGLHIVLFAGAAAMLSTVLTGILKNPERDGKWLPAILGGAAAAFMQQMPF